MRGPFTAWRFSTIECFSLHIFKGRGEEHVGEGITK